MIANKGQLRRKSGEELVNQSSCLNLVTNAVNKDLTLPTSLRFLQTNPWQQTAEVGRKAKMCW